jgi:hypothetical protein
LAGECLQAESLDAGVADAAEGPDAAPSYPFTRIMAGSGTQEALSVDLAGTGAIFVGGRFFSETDLGGGTISAGPSSDAFVAKYTRDGSLMWARQAYGQGAFASRVAVAPDGSVYVGGYGFSGAGGNVVGGDVMSTHHIARYSASGVPIWTRRFSDNSQSTLVAMTALPDGDVVALVNFQQGIDLGGGYLTVPYYAFALVRYRAADAAHVWSFTIGGTGYDDGAGLASIDNTLIVAASMTGTVNFPGANLPSPGLGDMVLIAFDADSRAHVWSKLLGGSDEDRAWDVSRSGELLTIVGRCTGAVSLGGSVIGRDGATSICVASLDGISGAHRWSSAFAVEGSPPITLWPWHVATAADGSAVVGGSSAYPVDFGPRPSLPT